MTGQQISEFYGKHKRRLFTTSLRILGDSMEAEEIMQDTIIKYLRLLQDGSTKVPRRTEQVSAWLLKTCVRASIDTLRRKKSCEKFMEDYRYGIRDSEAVEQEGSELWNALLLENEKAELIRMVRTAMSGLPDGYRTIVSLILFEGMDYEEVSGILNVSEVTVRTQYMRGRLRLMEEIRKQKK